jgi:Flp pilus assembly protein TadB
MKGLLPEVADLELLGITEVDFVRRLMQRTIFATVCGLLSTILWISVWDKPPLIVVILLCIAVPYISWQVPVKQVATASRVRRSDMDLAVAVYLDLVNVLLAGGAGVETAMLAAAGAGDGFSFEQIRLALVRAQSSRGSYWDSLRELGERTGVESLEDVAHSVQLAGEHGARIRQSLAAKATALRSKNLARIEHEAEQRTEHMGLPIVLLFLGFIMLVGYPAFVGTLGAL